MLTFVYRELEQVRKEAEEKFEEFVQKFIAICQELIGLGANPGETVQKLRDFRGEKGRKTKKSPAELQAQLLRNLVHNKTAHHGGGLFGGHHGGGLFGRPAAAHHGGLFGAQVLDII